MIAGQLLVESAMHAVATSGSCFLFPAPLLGCCLRDLPPPSLIYCFIGLKQEKCIWKSVCNSL